MSPGRLEFRWTSTRTRPHKHQVCSNPNDPDLETDREPGARLCQSLDNSVADPIINFTHASVASRKTRCEPTPEARAKVAQVVVRPVFRGPGS